MSLLVVTAAGCSGKSILAKGEKSPAGQFGKTIIEALENHRVQEILPHLDAALMTPDAGDTVTTLVDFFPFGQQGRTRLVVFTSNRVIGPHMDFTNYKLAFESSYAGKYLLTGMAVKEEGEKLTLLGLHVQRLPRSMETTNAFTFTGRRPIHFVFFFGLPLCVAITVAAVVRWTRCRKTLHRRRLWLAAIVLGIGKVGLNWTTGAVAFSLLNLQLFSAGFGREGAYGVWSLYLSLPIGALVFLFRKAPAVPPPGPDAF